MPGVTVQQTLSAGTRRAKSEQAEGGWFNPSIQRLSWMVLPVVIRLGYLVLLPHTRLDGIAVVSASTIAKNVPLPCQREPIWVWSSMNGSQRGRPSFCVLDFVKAEMAENKVEEIVVPKS